MKKTNSTGKVYFTFLNNCREFIENGKIQQFKYQTIVNFLEFQSFANRKSIPTKIQIGRKVVKFFVKPDFTLGYYDYSNF